LAALVVCGLASAETTATTKKKTATKTTTRTAHPAAKGSVAATKSAATKSTISKPAGAKTTAAKAIPKTAPAKTGTVAARSKNTRNTKTKRVARSYQQAPTTDRYKEIQQALIDKGYLHGEATGEWGPDSVDALRRFQTDQNITSDGKIGALSLIALGLGPKRFTAQTAPPQPPPAEAPK